MSGSTEKSWLFVAGVADPELTQRLRMHIAEKEQEGVIPAGESARVAKLSTALTRGTFVVSPERLELLRGLCQIYSAGILAERITSHRRVVGPVIVFFKKILFRIVAALLGPSFTSQRYFNAGVIRLLGSLCNEAQKSAHPHDS